MEMNQLRALCQVVRSGSMTKAALELHCVQSNVTSRIKSLEEITGTPLFYRSGRKLILTSSGKIIHVKLKEHYIIYITITLLTLIVIYFYLINKDKTIQDRTEYAQKSIQIK